MGASADDVTSLTSHKLQEGFGVRWQAQQSGKGLGEGGHVFTFTEHLLPVPPGVRNSHGGSNVYVVPPECQTQL